MALLDALKDRLTLSETRLLSFKVGVDDADLSLATKSDKLLELIRYCRHRRDFGAILVWLRDDRPDILRDLAFEIPDVATPPPPPRTTVPPSPILIPQSVSPPSDVLTVGVRLTDPKGVTMVYVPPGAFMMGSRHEDDEQPPHEVVIERGFWLDLIPVTNGMYEQFIKAGGYQTRKLWTKGGWAWVRANKKTGPVDYEGFTSADQPRVGVTWFEAFAYCRWRGGRLPTEAEWEWAARGPKNRVYPWGNRFDANRVIYTQNSHGHTAVVNAETRLAGASWVGAIDMSGNVSEWVSSLYRPYPYISADGREDLEDDATARTLHGGSCVLNEYGLRAANRYGLLPTVVSFGGGLRCARSA